MKTIKNIIYGVMAGVTFGLTSCDAFLEEKPLDQKSSSQFWQSKEDAQTGVDALYFGGVPYLNQNGGGWQPKATMYGGIISGLFYDDHGDSQLAEAAKACTYTLEKFSSPAMSLWHEFYKGISRANFVLANVPKMTDVLDQATIDNYVAEGKFFRAYAYFYLVKEFGDVPYVDEPYTSTDGMFKERTPAAEVYQHVIDDLTDITTGSALPNKSFYDNGCRVTRAMAQTLLAQVYLQRAGFPMNGGTEDYKKAAQMAEMVIDGGTAALEQANGSSDDLNSAYNVIKTSKTSKEIIFAKEYDYANNNIGNGYVNLSIGSDATTWKDANGNQVFSMNVLHKAYHPCDMLFKSYAPEDIRSHEKQFFFNTYTDKTGVEHTLNYTGIWAWFDEDAIIKNHGGDYNIPTMRYAEVLLIAAEGHARTGNTAKAQEYLNQVRKRAGLAAETATGDELVAAILTERLHEFPVEFKVWDDIRRTRLYPEAAGDYSGKLNWVALSSAKIQNKPVDNVKVGAIPEWVLLWPVPQDEIQHNPALTQNPGWE
jgi:hypothetical protein